MAPGEVMIQKPMWFACRGRLTWTYKNRVVENSPYHRITVWHFNMINIHSCPLSSDAIASINHVNAMWKAPLQTLFNQGIWMGIVGLIQHEQAAKCFSTSQPNYRLFARPKRALDRALKKWTRKIRLPKILQYVSETSRPRCREASTDVHKCRK